MENFHIYTNSTIGQVMTKAGGRGLELGRTVRAFANSYLLEVFAVGNTFRVEGKSYPVPAGVLLDVEKLAAWMQKKIQNRYEYFCQRYA